MLTVGCCVFSDHSKLVFGREQCKHGIDSLFTLCSKVLSYRLVIMFAQILYSQSLSATMLKRRNKDHGQSLERSEAMTTSITALGK